MKTPSGSRTPLSIMLPIRSEEDKAIEASAHTSKDDGSTADREVVIRTPRDMQVPEVLVGTSPESYIPKVTVNILGDVQHWNIPRGCFRCRYP